MHEATIQSNSDGAAAPAAQPLAPRRLARLVARRYRSAGASLRAELLACLIRPLGTLGLAAVGSGAFAALLDLRRAGPVLGHVQALTRYSSDQIVELGLFVAQVSPAALQQAARIAWDTAHLHGR